MKLLACEMYPVRVPAEMVTVSWMKICSRTIVVVCCRIYNLNPLEVLPKVPANCGLKIPMIFRLSPVPRVLLMFWHSIERWSGHTKVVMTWL